MVRGQGESLGKLKASLNPSYKYIWIHAASLGEFEQGRPLMEKLKAMRPELKILLTFFSPSGYEVRKNFAGADIVAYLPIDTAANAKRFVQMVQPEMAVFVKYEFWRNYLRELKKHDIPTYLISAIFRPNQLFFKSWGKWYAAWLHLFTHIFVQDTGSRDLLKQIGYYDVTVAGDTRFDRVSAIKAAGHHLPEIERFLQNPHQATLVVGSSWPADEDVYVPWLNRHPEVLAIIAPHEFDDERLKKLMQRLGNGALKHSDALIDPGLLKGKNRLVIDSFGLLSSLYTYADMAYVGGGFGAGLHNINEAAVYGTPVAYGPNHHKFLEARELAEYGGGFPVKSRSDFEAVADYWLHNPDARRQAGDLAAVYIGTKLGATDKVYHAIFE